MIPGLLKRLLDRRPSFLGVGGFTPDEPLLKSIAAHPAGSTMCDLSEIEDPQTSEGSGPIVVLVRTYADLHRAAQVRCLLPSGDHLVVAVAESRPLHQPTSVRLPPGRPWSSLRELRLARGPGHYWRAEAHLTEYAPIGSLIRALLAQRTPQTVPHAPRLAAADRSALDWTVGTHATLLDPAAEEYAADVIVRTDAAPSSGVGRKLVRLPRSGTSTRAPEDEVHTDPGSILLPPVDEHAVNPMGFTAAASRGHASMSFQGTGWFVDADDAPPVALPGDGTITEAEIAALRSLRSVSVDWDTHPGSIAALRTVAALASAGVPLLSKVKAPLWALPLSHELRRLIDCVRPEDLDDTMGRELHSVRIRRVALRDHSSHAHRGRLGLPTSAPPVSVLLCTRRPQFLASVLKQIDGQRYEDIEVVLVLHGIGEDTPGVAEAVKGFGRTITVIEAPESTVFGAVLNRGVAAAGGEYVTKFDDDDWYSPHHVTDLLQAARYSNADVVGLQAELVHLEQLRTTIRRKRYSESYTDHLSGGTLMFRREYFRGLGGYRPVPTSEDRGLLEDTADVGGSIYGMHGLGYVLSRHSSGHTWSAETPYFLRGNIQQWPGRNLGPAVAADDLDSPIGRLRKA